MIDWKTVKEYEDITYKKCGAVARIAFNRPEVRNAFRPKTTSELYMARFHPYFARFTSVLVHQKTKN